MHSQTTSAYQGAFLFTDMTELLKAELDRHATSEVRPSRATNSRTVRMVMLPK